jgi:hypothetical protein
MPAPDDEALLLISFGLFGKSLPTINQFFNAGAHERASRNRVELLDQNHLGQLLSEHTVTLLELERILYSDWAQTEEPADA